ncbi:MAG: hypothetical protein WBW41_02975 [Verrucomicrobiia bacterium]
MKPAIMTVPAPVTRKPRAAKNNRCAFFKLVIMASQLLIQKISVKLFFGFFDTAFAGPDTGTPPRRGAEKPERDFARRSGWGEAADEAI